MHDNFENQDDEQIQQKHTPQNVFKLATREQMMLQPQYFALNFKDVYNTVRAFDGTDVYPVERWIDDFEDVAILFGWTCWN